MQPIKIKGRRFWYVDFVDDSDPAKPRRVRQSLGVETKIEAEEIVAKMRRERFQERLAGRPLHSSFMSELTRYAKIQKAKNPAGYAASTHSRLKRFADLFEQKTLQEITDEAVSDYYFDRIDGGAARSTIKRELTILKAILNQAIKGRRLTELPEFPEIKVEDAREVYLTREQESALLEEAASHLKPIIVFALDTGARRGEVLSLKWENVDLDRRIVTFRNTKTKTPRHIPLSSRVQEVLKELGRRQGHVFLYRGQPIASLKNSFRGACDRAKLDGVRFHDLRHTFASRVLQTGTSLPELQRLLGHSDYKMTLRYAHLAQDFDSRAIARLDDWHTSGTLT